MSQQQQQLVGGQLSEDTFLYVWTPTHVSRLNRKNKITSPQLQLPWDVIHQKTNNSSSKPSTADSSTSTKTPTCKIVLLRGVVKAESEQDDPVGVFLHFVYPPSAHVDDKDKKGEVPQVSLRCKLSVTCTPVRPGGHSHSAGPEEFLYSAQENFKGMKSLLPAVALKQKQQQVGSSSTAAKNTNDEENSSSPLSKQEQDEIRFNETSPVEVHVKIQFLKNNFSSSESNLNNKEGEELQQKIMNQASSLFSSASTTLGSWWSAAATTGKEKVLPSMKTAFSNAANKAESLAHRMMNDRAEGGGGGVEEISQHQQNNHSHQEISSSLVENNNNNHHQNNSITPWNELPQNYFSSSSSSQQESKIKKWQELITKNIVQDQDCNFLWAPESAFGFSSSSTSSTSNQTNSTNKNHPRYPYFTFSPEEELALSQCGLSANQLLHCNDQYNFDHDIDESFINPKDPWTQHLRQMRLHLVPRLVTEERFWAAYLWRVKCLSFCKNVEQEAIVKTLISKPDVEPLYDPRNHQQGQDHQNENGTKSTTNDKNKNSENNNDNDDENENLHHKNLLEDAKEAFTLLEEVVNERTTEGVSQEEETSALLTASIRGAERSLRNLTDSIKALDEVLTTKTEAVPSLRENWKSQWRELSDEKKRLEELIEKAKKPVVAPASSSVAETPAAEKKEEEDDQIPQNTSKNKNDSDEELENEIKKKQQIAKLSEIENISSPAPAKPSSSSSPKVDDDQKKDISASPTKSVSTSKPRAPVLMPWEEEEDE